jgi:hypothetical protein
MPHIHLVNKSTDSTQFISVDLKLPLIFYKRVHLVLNQESDPTVIKILFASVSSKYTKNGTFVKN